MKALAAALILLFATGSAFGFQDQASLLDDGASVSHIGLGSAEWDRILNRAGSKILFGVSLQGPSPYARNNTVSFLPASNSKLFTAGAALELLGPSFHYETKLRWKRVRAGSDTEITELEIVGDGDPTWGLHDFEDNVSTRADALVRLLLDRGVKTVRGTPKAVAGDSRWNAARYPEGWGQFTRVSCNTSIPLAFTIALNCATYEVTSTTKGAWLEPAVPTKIVLSLKAGTSNEVTVRALEKEGLSLGFELVGTINEAKGPLRIRLPVHQSNQWAERLLSRALRKAGIAQRRTMGKALASGESEEQSFFSAPLSAIFRPFLKRSVNTMGEALLRTFGARFAANEPDLLRAGQLALREYVAGIGSMAALVVGEAPQRDFFSGEVELFDGSGISRESHVTTSAVMALLLDLRARDDFPILLEALPLAGVDGTLKNRMRGTAAQGRLRAKTGTLDGVYNLSGYVPRFSSEGIIIEQIPFVTLTRTTADKADEAHAIQDEFGAELARILSNNLK